MHIRKPHIVLAAMGFILLSLLWILQQQRIRIEFPESGGFILYEGSEKLMWLVEGKKEYRYTFIVEDDEELIIDKIEIIDVGKNDIPDTTRFFITINHISGIFTLSQDKIVFDTLNLTKSNDPELIRIREHLIQNVKSYEKKFVELKNNIYELREN